METPVAGQEIVDAAGEGIGLVREVQGGYFKVDSAMARDYWLSCAYIESGERLRLALINGELDQHKLDEPGMEPVVDSDSGARTDAILTSDEALAQRERMERELEEQRRRLR